MCINYRYSDVLQYKKQSIDWKIRRLLLLFFKSILFLFCSQNIPPIIISMKQNYLKFLLHVYNICTTSTPC